MNHFTTVENNIGSNLNKENRSIWRSEPEKRAIVSETDIIGLICKQVRNERPCINRKKCSEVDGITEEVIQRFRKVFWEPEDDYGAPVQYRKCKLLQILFDCFIISPGTTSLIPYIHIMISICFFIC
jgi:hypothetical protein